MSFFDVKSLLAPFVDEARAADRRRRLEYLHVRELCKASIAHSLASLVPAGESAAWSHATKLAQKEVERTFALAEAALEQEELGRG